MGLLTTLQRWLAGDGGDGSDRAAPDAVDSDVKTRIDDAEATSLRAIKLPDAEREALDAEEREVVDAEEPEP